MVAYARRQRRVVDIWPGWVDALSTLLVIIIFVLLVFVLGQYFLGQALTRRDQALSQLNVQVAQLGEMLALERKARTDLELTVGRLTSDLQTAPTANADLTSQLTAKTEEAAQLSQSLAAATAASV